MMRKINKKWYSLATADICLGMGILFLWPCMYSSAFCINPGILHKHTDDSMAYITIVTLITCSTCSNT